MTVRDLPTIETLVLEAVGATLDEVGDKRVITITTRLFDGTAADPGLNLDSLAVLNIVSRIEAELGVKITDPSPLFDIDTTCRELARRVAAL